MSDYCFPERRSKGKDKRRNKKKHPYKHGGRNRTWKREDREEKKE